MDILKETLLSSVYDVAIKTPLQKADKLTNNIGVPLFLKREDLQPVKSFKLRGAYHKISHLTQKQRKAGVITASAGNHAQGVALSAIKCDTTAVIVMPTTTPQIKIDAVKKLGADVILHGDSFSEAYDHCMSIAKSTNRVFIHPFDDKDVIIGQGTIGLELLEQLPKVSNIFVGTGGGGMLAGIAQLIKNINPSVKVISVEPEDSAAMKRSIEASRRITLEHVGIFADGVAVKQVGKNTYDLAKLYVDDYITVTADEICAAIKYIFEDTRSIVEPAGALGVAGAVKYAQNNTSNKSDNYVAICSGANMTFEKLQFIAERTLLGSGKELLLAVSLSEQPGALRHFCNTVIAKHNITEFNYRLASRRKAYILVGINISEPDQRQSVLDDLSKHAYDFVDLSSNEITKEHIRHMIGGKSSETRDEVLYKINFPDRPGALKDFLLAIGDRWNISLFHYRGQGGDVGRVLLGLEVPLAERQDCEDALTSLHFDYENLTDDPAYQIFIA